MYEVTKLSVLIKHIFNFYRRVYENLRRINCCFYNYSIPFGGGGIGICVVLFEFFRLTFFFFVNGDSSG